MEEGIFVAPYGRLFFTFGQYGPIVLIPTLSTLHLSIAVS